MKSTLYIKHDLYATNDMNIMLLLDKYHEAGYGVWWCIVELLTREETNSLKKETLIAYVKTTLKTKNLKTLTAIVDYCIEQGLLVEKDGYIFNERIIRQCNEFKEISRKNTENVKKYWENRKKEGLPNDGNTTVSQSNNDGCSNKIKENKIKENKDTSGEPDFSEEKNSSNDSKNEYADFVAETYKAICKDKFNNILSLSDTRKSHCNALVSKYGKEKVKEGFEKASKSSFLIGVNNEGWKATFDWLILPNNFLKVLEGNYDDKEPVKQLPKSSISSRQEVEASMNAEGGIDL